MPKGNWGTCGSDRRRKPPLTEAPPWANGRLTRSQTAPTPLTDTGVKPQAAKRVFLEHRPEKRDPVVFVPFAVPSRQGTLEYDLLTEEVQREVKFPEWP